MAFRLLGNRFLQRASNRVTGGIRKFSGDINDPSHQKGADTWMMISKGAIAAVGVFTLYMSVQIIGHDDHHGHPEQRPYLHIRKKAYPWAEENCNLFDTECKRKARRLKAGLSA